MWFGGDPRGCMKHGNWDGDQVPIGPKSIQESLRFLL